MVLRRYWDLKEREGRRGVSDVSDRRSAVMDDAVSVARDGFFADKGGGGCGVCGVEERCGVRRGEERCRVRRGEQRSRRVDHRISMGLDGFLLVCRIMEKKFF